MSDSTSSFGVVVADTIVRTVELGVTIAVVDGDVTVVFCELLDDGRRHCAGCGAKGVYRDTVIRAVTDVPVVGHPLRVICHEDGTTGWPVTMDHLFGSLGMIGGRQAGVNRGFLSASVGLAFDDEFVCC